MIRAAIQKVKAYNIAAQATVKAAQGVTDSLKGNGVALEKLKPK